MDAAAARTAVVRRRARAKINLFLHVVGRRDDGYHLLDSLVAFAEIGDEVSAGPARSLTLRVDGPMAGALAGALASDADNLVLRAARALAEAAGLGGGAGAAIALTKRLPVAAGIGGGSADAAAALSALAELWGVSLPPGRWADLALGLGADVPVCLAGRTARVGGIGELLSPAPRFDAVPAVLANPGVQLATADVFRARTGPFGAPAGALPEELAAGELIVRCAAARNDLEAAARTLAPAIGPVLDALRAAPGCGLARLSGSGPTCFGLFRKAEDARAAAAEIAAANPSWWVAETAIGGG